MKKFEDVVMIPHVQVRNNALLFFNLPDKNIWHKNQITASKTYSGDVGAGAKKRISTAVDLMLQMYCKRKVLNPSSLKFVTHRIAFITLTISANEIHLTSDAGYKMLLSKFLLRAKRSLGLTCYTWKAEFQKNGQLHYHIVTPSFIPWLRLRNLWNEILKDANMLGSYKASHGNYNANSTDIHNVYAIKDMQGYLMKYVAKASKEKNINPYPIPYKFPINSITSFIKTSKKMHVVKKENWLSGKIWDCSLNLKGVKLYKFVESSNSISNVDISKAKKLDNAIYFKTQDPVSHLDLKHKELHSLYIHNLKKQKK